MFAEPLGPPPFELGNIIANVHQQCSVWLKIFPKFSIVQPTPAVSGHCRMYKAAASISHFNYVLKTSTKKKYSRLDHGNLTCLGSLQRVSVVCSTAPTVTLKLKRITVAAVLHSPIKTEKELPKI